MNAIGVRGLEPRGPSLAAPYPSPLPARAEREGPARREGDGRSADPGINP